MVIVYPEGAFYSRVKVEDVDEIVSEHLIKGRIVPAAALPRLRWHEDNTVKALDDVGLLPQAEARRAAQLRRHRPRRTSTSTSPSTATRPWQKVLTEMTPEEVIDAISKSGLRGRGGGGFPTGKKWQFAAAASSPEYKKYVCCNADEGDPGAFMDRSVLEGDPHAVLEAMAIAGYAIGSDQGYIYVRAEYPIAVKRLEIAIDQAREYGLLGEDIFGTGFNFNIDIRLGAGAFVCGEETALMHSIEGNRGEPWPASAVPGRSAACSASPPSSTTSRPTPTSARSSSRARTGSPPWAPSAPRAPRCSPWAARSTTPAWWKCRWAPRCARSSMRSAAASPAARSSRPCRPAAPPAAACRRSMLDTPIDYDNLIAAGSMMGSGGMIVMDEDNCMVDIARFFLDFTVDESCGKCTPCRIGTRRMLEILNRICEGKGEDGDIERLENLAAEHQGHGPVRPGPDRAQPGAVHPQAFPP